MKQDDQYSGASNEALLGGSSGGGGTMEEVSMIGSANTAEEDSIPTSSLEVDAVLKRKGSRSSASGSSVKTRRNMKSKSSKLQKESAAAATNQLIKKGSLVLLVAQMVGLVLLMRYSRTHPQPGQGLYVASTAVFIMELMKFVICLGVILYQADFEVTQFATQVMDCTYGSPMELLKLCVPSLLYTIQNNLLYFALTNLDAATYQVCYQLKILTTAIFSVILLRRRFSPLKWASLVMLTIGVAIVEVSGSKDSHSTGGGGGGDGATISEGEAQHNRYVGLLAVLCAACTSGFAGVYFERILKGSPSVSLWIRNIQMGLPSLVIAYLTIYAHDAELVKEQGFFFGYSGIVWTVVSIQAGGGLLVALVVKYADNVLKVFATSFSIVLSCLVSAVVFDFRPTWSFLFGSSLVMISTVLYGRPEKQKKRKKSSKSGVGGSSSNGPTILPLSRAGGAGAGAAVVTPQRKPGRKTAQVM